MWTCSQRDALDIMGFLQFKRGGVDLTLVMQPSDLLVDVQRSWHF